MTTYAAKNAGGMGVPASPYYYGGPVKEPQDFFGRSEQLQTIFEHLGKGGSTSLVGPRRVGKTSLLYHLMTDVAHKAYAFDARDVVFVYMDPQLGILDPAGFYRELVDALADQVPALAVDGKIEVTERHVRAALKQLAPRRLVLLLDEFQTISSVGNFPEGFFRFLRGLDRYQVCFVTATMEKLYDCCPAEVISSPFANIFATVYIGSWTEDELDSFLAETSARSGAPMQAYKNEIQELAGRFPFFVQIAGSFYFDTWRKRGRITAQDHLAIRNGFADEARAHLERMWKSHVTPSEKAALVALAHGRECGDSATLRSLEQKGYVLAGQLFSSALADLILRKVVEDTLPPDGVSPRQGPLTKGVWVDRASGDVWVDGKRIKPLTKLEYKLLVHLYDNANCICDKYGIVEAVWSSDYIDQVDDPRIAKLVSRLRDSVEPDPDNSRYIMTVHGRGYKLVSESE